MNKIIKIFFFNIIFFLLIFLSVELYLKYFKKNHLEYDKILGWKLKKNLNLIKEETDFYNKKYKVEFNTDENGFISHGNTSKNEIVVIGDSFSTDPYVSSSKMWHAILANNFKVNKNININIKVLGAGGYGTLQQYILLQENKNKLNPKIIIMQFCSNDFENNYLHLEKLKGSINQYSRRPFIKNGDIIYDEDFFSRILRLKYFGESRIINKIIFLIFNKEYNKKISEEHFKNSEIITMELLKKIRKIFPNKDYYIFNCNLEKIDLDFYAKEANYKLLNNIKKNLKKAKNDSQKIYFRDGGHYNELGNKIIGDSVYEDLKKLNIFINLK
tara:strand:- start:742 stop:1728 length:987 start_codon:yes stop_codon:yes gene_type:complete